MPISGRLELRLGCQEVGSAHSGVVAARKVGAVAIRSVKERGAQRVPTSGPGWGTLIKYT
jgi:hypothetical protein